MLKALVLLLAAITLAGCAGLGEAPPTTTHVSLELAPRADFQDAFRASLETLPEGAAICHCDYGSRRETHYFSATQVTQLMRGLGAAGLADLSDADSGDPEAEVLYTRFEVRCGQYHTQTRWRGLPPAQARMAQALLDSPLGPLLWRGLEEVRRRK